MLSLYFVILFFIIIFNIIIQKILEKQKLELKLYKKINDNGLTTISCINNYWFVFFRDTKGIDLKYIERDNKMLKCNLEFNKDIDKLSSCGKNGMYYNKSNPCWIAMSELLFMLD